MKRLKMKLITPMVLLVAMLSGQAYGQSTVPFEVNRLGLLTVGETDYYIPIPDGYSLEAADRRMGPDKSWLKASWLPEGRQMSNWSEMMSFLILPHNAPPIDVMAAQLSKSCPKSVFKERAAVPKFVIAQEDVVAVQMGCGPDDTSPMALKGYYVAIRTKDYSYLLSRETRFNTQRGEVGLSDAPLTDWQRTIEKFAVCAKGDFCAKLRR